MSATKLSVKATSYFQEKIQRILVSVSQIFMIALSKNLMHSVFGRAINEYSNQTF